MAGRDVDASKPDCCISALRAAHQETRDRLTVLAEDLLAELPCGTGLEVARTALVEYVRAGIIPSAQAEESVATSAQDDSLRRVVRALPGHHRVLAALADEISANHGEAATAAAVGALVLLCDARWDGEDAVLIPALASTGVDLEALVR